MGTIELSREVQIKPKGALTGPFFYVMIRSMKTTIDKPIKLRNRVNPTEFYWTYSSWGSNFVDGVEFLPVTRFDPSDNRTKQLYYVRKDSLEKVKNA